MKHLLMFMVMALVCLSGSLAGEEDPFGQFCRKAAENDGVEFVRVDGALLGMARAFMDREGKALMKSMKVKSMDMLLMERCGEETRSSVMEEARALLEGGTYTKIPTEGGGNPFYLERGEDAQTFTALIVLFDADSHSGLYRLCGDISTAELEKIIL